MGDMAASSMDTGSTMMGWEGLNGLHSCCILSLSFLSLLPLLYFGVQLADVPGDSSAHASLSSPGIAPSTGNPLAAWINASK